MRTAFLWGLHLLRPWVGSERKSLCPSGKCCLSRRERDYRLKGSGPIAWLLSASGSIK